MLRSQFARSNFRVRRFSAERNSSSNALLIVGATGLGALGGYYYYQTTKPVDYQRVYNSIAKKLENVDYDDGSFAPVLLRLAWHAAGTYDKDSNTGNI